MAINSTGLQPGQGSGEENNRSHTLFSSDVVAALSAVSLRCVECLALYPALEAGQRASLPRYRCACGGVLDVEMKLRLPHQRSPVAREGGDVFLDFDAGTGGAPAAGAEWRQLFDERATTPPIWSISTDKLFGASSSMNALPLLLSGLSVRTNYCSIAAVSGAIVN